MAFESLAFEIGDRGLETAAGAGSSQPLAGRSTKEWHMVELKNSRMMLRANERNGGVIAVSCFSHLLFSCKYLASYSAPRAETLRICCVASDPNTFYSSFGTVVSCTVAPDAPVLPPAPKDDVRY